VVSRRVYKYFSIKAAPLRGAAGLAGRVLAYACGSEAQAMALMDNLITGLVQERTQAPAL
jgi:hypothetical protein